MFEITHKCKELKSANNVNSGDITIYYSKFGENSFDEWLMRNEELDDYGNQIIDTLGIKYCLFCGKKLSLKEEL